jgi:hypothetical protein
MDIQIFLGTTLASAALVTTVLGIGRYFGRKDKVIEDLEKSPKLDEKTLERHQLQCPYGLQINALKFSLDVLNGDLRLLRNEVGEVKEDVAKLDGKVDGIKSTIEFIGNLIKNGNGGSK